MFVCHIVAPNTDSLVTNYGGFMEWRILRTVFFSLDFEEFHLLVSLVQTSESLFCRYRFDT